MPTKLMKWYYSMDHWSIGFSFFSGSVYLERVGLLFHLVLHDDVIDDVEYFCEGV